ncbi:MAG: flagellar basal body L-ring protein FlgH [Lamprobacter sp.]|uniref:flagellar basal body L-ring protein FlgH n=1 Tax=Lamprobacter sp. TaxID=3100796 RepID=UPI002B25EF5B|nr:flagellar basal body L-ring protein FlgH [Lamprobacter sp.]MEA3639794.1 flagellar basal body L-ring protein FlgH [Lamprobacter sp.]
MSLGDLMITRIATLLLCSSLLGLAGCAQVPRRSVVPDYQPVQIPEPPMRVANGSIYQQRRGVRPLFEDSRPRMPGDILTIVLDEQVSATKNSSSNASRSGSANVDLVQLPAPLADRISELEQLGFDISGASDFSGRGGSQARNSFTGTITVTVVDLMPNGNLRVHGEKQIAINQGVEYIRFSGVVDPLTISGRNTVPSTTVADARIEYVGDGYISEAQHMGWLQRFFLNISPI